MHELPEVETVCRGLAGDLKGRTLVRVITRRPNLRFPLPNDLGRRLTGHRIQAVKRRAKSAVFVCDQVRWPKPRD